ARHAGARRHRHRRAAHDFDRSRHQQRHLQCHRCPCAGYALHTRQGTCSPLEERRECIMKAFTYYRPKTAQQAVGLLDSKWGKTELLAGGTDLHDLQKEYVAEPEKVISVGGITGLAGINADRNAVTIGAGTKLAAIAEHPRLRKAFPALTTAAGDVGGPQIQNMGTLGGNLCQRTRCWYFRDEHVKCLLKGGEKCFALDGENRYHAIYTKGHKCVIVSPSTLAPPLIALGAMVQVLGPKGKEEVELARFFHAPESADEREHILKPNQIVLSVTIPE